MASTWSTHLLEALPLGGSLMAYAVAVPDSLATVQAIRVRVGPAAAISYNDPNPALAIVDLVLGADGFWRNSAFGLTALSGQTASWFANVGGTWEAGPVDTALDLTPRADFESPQAQAREWLVARLQEAVAQFPAPGTRAVMVRISFPRDTTGWPMVTVTQDAESVNAALIRDAEDATRTGRLMNTSLSAILWCASPEDRSRLVPWFSKVCLLVSKLAEFGGYLEPTWTLDESEDFESLGVPTFLSTVRFTLTNNLSINILDRPSVGALTV